MSGVVLRGLGDETGAGPGQGGRRHGPCGRVVSSPNWRSVMAGTYRVASPA